MLDIIFALDRRLHLYHDIYFHRVSMAASLLIAELLKNNFKKLDLIEKTKDMCKFLCVNDYFILGQLYDDPHCQLLQKRVLPKMIYEEIVDASKIYCEQEYVSKWCNGMLLPTQRIVKTRIISGISPKKFDQYCIKIKSNDKIISCEQALQQLKYKIPQEPYYFVRLYEMPVVSKL